MGGQSVREIRERPILFSAPMVRAILDNRKTQTRRVMRPQPNLVTVEDLACLSPPVKYPYGFESDRLWVREACRAEELESGIDIVRYVADDDYWPIGNTQQASDAWAKMYGYAKGKGRPVPGIHMPRWASRILLEIVDVRIQRLNEISESDAIAEGIHQFHGLEVFGYDPKGTPGPMTGGSAVEAFYHLWQSINGPDSWQANPWVWVIEFKRISR